MAVMVPLEMEDGEGGIVVRISVIDENVPALLAKQVIKDHGRIINFPTMKLNFKQLGDNAALTLYDMGAKRSHVAVAATRFRTRPPAARAAIARCVERCCESVAMYKGSTAMVTTATATC